MIDYISIKVPIDTVKPYLENPLMSWIAEVSTDTGEVCKHKANYKNLYFRMFDTDSPYIEVKNSVHTFWHDANHTDFTIKDLSNTLQFFKERLGIDPEKSTLHGFEFGVNVEADRLPPEIFTHYLSHKNEPFKPMLKKHITGNKKATGAICEHSQVEIKVYDKGTQYNLDRYLMRFEIKITKMQILERSEISIIHLSDLLKIDVLKDLESVLISYYDDSMKRENYDPDSLKNLKGSDFDLWKLGQNIDYWNELKSKCKGTGNKTFSRKKKRFLELNKIVKTDDLHAKIRAKIVSKWQHLTDVGHLQQKAKSDPEFTTFENVPNESNPTPKRTKMTPFLQLVLRVNYGSIATLTNEQKARVEKRVCIVCEMDISHRQKGTLTCSKSCRNKKSNSTHDYTRKIRTDAKTVTLFDTSEMVNIEVLKVKKEKRLSKEVFNY